LERRHIQWLSDWDRRIDPLRQRSYVRDEVLRLKAEGQPVLYAALTTPLIEQRNLAFSVLREVHPIVSVRLHAEASPPTYDPNGKPLPKQDAGRVLVAKVGVVGQAPPGGRISEDEAALYAGPARAVLARSGGLYRVVRVTREPTSLPLDEAIALMQLWGHGVQDEEYRRRHRSAVLNPVTSKYEDKRIHQWLVEEVCPATLADDPAPAPAPQKRSA
jgi:hypothetical protein